MNAQPRRGSVQWWLVAWSATASSLLPQFAYSQLAQPVISSIQAQGTNIIVVASVPAGVKRVTLESRTRFGSGAWVPSAMAQISGTSGTVSFSLPAGKQTELLRVRADAQLPLPDAFYLGTHSFVGPATNSVAVRAGPASGGLLDGGLTQTPSSGSPRAVAESDIWEFNGETLYFFNQYRGLQVIDISNPDAAVVRGTLDLPAAGEQMYLVDSNHVVLLAAGGCAFNTQDSQAVVVGVSNGLPHVVTNLPIAGWIQESRMVGSALYVASQTYRPVPGATDGSWEWSTSVSSFDLSQPDLPVIRSTLWYDGYGNVVSATDTYLFVVTQDPTNWWQSVVRIIDVTAPGGTMAPYAQVRTAGQVRDKFKLNYADAVLTTISEDWHWDNGTVLVTKLETFNLPDPRSAAPGSIFKLGELALGQGEQLHATRFDGNLVYVVTFFQIDPLWVVDLSDSTRPHIAGSVGVPGWASYLLPLGPRLVTVGVVSNRVAVSLFDVHDPSNPASLSQVLLGQNYSWSEANNDEKAFTALTDIGLILVPYQGDTTNGWTSQVQLIDLTSSNLVARGIIEHQSQPRRAAFSHNRVLSLSPWELLSVDVSDRDHPQVKGDTDLAWSVDRLFAQGNYLLEVTESTGWWGFQAPASVRVALAQQPNQVVGKLDMGEMPIVGAGINNGRLYLAQSPSYFWPLPLDWPWDPCGTNGLLFVVTIVDLAGLPGLSVLGQVSNIVDIAGWGGDWQPVWPESDVLVWVGGGRNFWWLTPALGAVGAPGGLSGGATGMLWPFWGFGGGQLLAFDVRNPTAPKFDSEVNLATNGWWSFSQPFTSGSLVYLSHDAAELVSSLPDPGGVWVQRSYLDVVDYADPLSPTLRRPVNIPGTLHGLSHAGELLYTVGIHWDTNQITDWTEWLDASAYDGVAAHLVASLALPDSWPHPVLAVDTNLFIGRPGYSATTTNVVAPQLETWTLADSGKFTLLGSITPGAPASTLLDRSPLLAVQETDNSVELFDDSVPASLARVGHGQSPGCLWFDLDQADGTLGGGLWMPLGVYGMGKINPGP